MDPEVKVALPLKEIRVWGKRAILRRARKEHKCAASGLPIERGEEHYCVYICGAGLGDTKFPDRVRIECINDYLNFGGKSKPIAKSEPVAKSNPGKVSEPSTPSNPGVASDGRGAWVQIPPPLPIEVKK